jgi:hypothetical protein
MSMEARILRAALVVALLFLSVAAKHRTANYLVETANPQLAKQFAEAAESYRKTLAISWLGEELPNWSQPCPIKVTVGPSLGAGGETSFTFDRGQVFGWHMKIQGSAQRVLDSVLPHEITHMIFASHFRRPVPRWADEGGATSVEHVSERNKQRAMLDEYLRTNRGIAFNKMFAMTEYPADILPLYAQGYSTAEFLIQSGGRRKYIAFLDDGLKAGDWAGALRKHYNMKNLGELQITWLEWVKQGSPVKSPTALPTESGTLLAASEKTTPKSAVDLVLHTQDKAASARNGGGNANLPLERVKSMPASQAGAHNAAPYTPGSTIAVLRLSIPSTGWRSPYSTSMVANTPKNSALSDPYRAQVGRPQTIDAPTQTTMFR